jgi:hypothetical protein
MIWIELFDSSSFYLSVVNCDVLTEICDVPGGLAVHPSQNVFLRAKKISGKTTAFAIMVRDPFLIRVQNEA